MTREEEIANLKAKIKARKGHGGYAKNVADMEARLAVLEAG